ncbi:MAG TPA: hypothetical protein VLF90_03125 [Patescibacteria group bacterium]|nr:hypothetical protein [Patescibacteria group bacterium]
MDTAAAALLIVVSTTLSVFLVVCIIAVIKINKILSDVHHITEKASQITDKAGAVSEFFQKNSVPTAIIKIISNVANSFKEGKKSNKEEEL